MVNFNPTGTPPKKEREDNIGQTGFERLDSYGERTFRFVKRIKTCWLVFVPCIGEDGVSLMRAFRLGKEQTILDDLRRIDYKILQEEFPVKDARPNSVLKRNQRHYFLVIDRADDMLKILEVPYSVNDQILSLREMISKKSNKYLKYGPYHLYDITVSKEKSRSGARFDVVYRVTPERSPSWDTIPVKALEQDYPTFEMINKFLQENKKDIGIDDETIAKFMKKYEKNIIEGIDEFTLEDENIISAVKRYITSVNLHYFTEDELEAISKFKISDDLITIDTNETILETLKKTPINLTGTIYDGTPTFRFPDKLLAKVSEEFRHLLVSPEETPSLEEPDFDDETMTDDEVDTFSDEDDKEEIPKFMR